MKRVDLEVLEEKGIRGRELLKSVTKRAQGEHKEISKCYWIF